MRRLCAYARRPRKCSGASRRRLADGCSGLYFVFVLLVFVFVFVLLLGLYGGYLTLLVVVFVAIAVVVPITLEMVYQIIIKD